MSVFCTSKLFTPYHHCKIFWATIFLCNTPLQQGSFISLYHDDYKNRANRAAAKAVSTSCEKEKRCKSAAKTREWRKCQSEEQQSEIRQSDLMGHAEGCACLSEDRRSKIRQTNLMGHAEGHACLSESDEVKYSRPIGRGLHRDAHFCQRSDEVKYGRPIRWGMQRGAHICQRSNMQIMVCIILFYYC